MKIIPRSFWQVYASIYVMSEGSSPACSLTAIKKMRMVYKAAVGQDIISTLLQNVNFSAISRGARGKLTAEGRT